MGGTQSTETPTTPTPPTSQGVRRHYPADPTTDPAHAAYAAKFPVVPRTPAPPPLPKFPAVPTHRPTLPTQPPRQQLPPVLADMLTWNAERITTFNKELFSKAFSTTDHKPFHQQFSDRVGKVLWLYVLKSWRATNRPVGLKAFTAATCKTVAKLRKVFKGEQAFDAWMTMMFPAGLSLADVAARLYAHYSPSVPQQCLTEPFVRMGVVVPNPGGGNTVVRPDAPPALLSQAQAAGKCMLLEMAPEFTAGRTCDDLDMWVPMPPSMWEPDNLQQYYGTGGGGGGDGGGGLGKKPALAMPVARGGGSKRRASRRRKTTKSRQSRRRHR